MYIIKLLVGNPKEKWANKSIFINSSLRPEKIQDYYKKGIEVIGYDFCKETCPEYGCDRIEKEHLLPFVENGFNAELLEDYYSPSDDYVEEDARGTAHIVAETFVMLYMFLIDLIYFKETGSHMEWSFVEENVRTICIGGTGVFY